MLSRVVPLLLLLTVPALAHDMSDPDAEWYQSLKVPGVSGYGSGLSGSSCCDGGKSPHPDCMNVETRQVRDADGSIHIEAWIDSKTFPDTNYSPIYGHAANDWVRVPDGAIIYGKSNPTSMPVVCWYNSSIRCFIPGTGT